MTKPIVHYKGKAIPFMGGALLLPINHPNHQPGHEVSNMQTVRTSRVLSWGDDGTIETQNTIYKPAAEVTQ